MRNALGAKKLVGDSKSRGIRTGCLIFAGILPAGLIIAIFVIRTSLAGIFDTPQRAIAPPALTDNTSPETLRARREQEEARLNSYGWLDEEAGLLRIPIDRAMALIAERGLPVGGATTETARLEEAPALSVAGAAPPQGTPAAAPPLAVTPARTPGPDETVEAPGEQTPTPEPAPTVNLAEVSFTEHVLPIFEQHCLQCHGGEKPEGGQRIEEGLILKTYQDIMAGSFNGPVIEPGDVAGSYLIEQITSGRMPKEGPRLLPAEIAIVTAWVEAGAPDN